VRKTNTANMATYSQSTCARSIGIESHPFLSRYIIQLTQSRDAGHPVAIWISFRNGFQTFGFTRYTSLLMPNVLILTEVQEAMRARYKAMLLERFPQLTINVVGHHNDVDPYIADIDILLCRKRPSPTCCRLPAICRARSVHKMITDGNAGRRSFWQARPLEFWAWG
jgi:hypothetical protein